MTELRCSSCAPWDLTRVWPGPVPLAEWPSCPNQLFPQPRSCRGLCGLWLPHRKAETRLQGPEE